MRLLRVIASMDPTHGGPCQGIRNAIPELEKLGVQNEIVCLDDPHSAFINKDTFQIHAIGPGKSSWRYNDRLTNWLLSNIIRFDVVIVHGLWLYHGFAVRQVVRLLSEQQKHMDVGAKKVPKLFIMPHGMLDPYFQKASGRKLKAIRNWFYWKLIECKLVNDADGLLFTCQKELELARVTFHPYRPKKELNVGYGIQEPPSFSLNLLTAFLEKCPGIVDKPYFLFLSRIHEKKGVDLLLNAYADILNSIENESIEMPINSLGESLSITHKICKNTMPKLVIAGPGLDSSYGQWVREIVNNNHLLKDFVFFPGMLTDKAKWGAFYGCEAFVLPSHQENFGIAVVEALACSKPVLVSNQVNICREIQEAGGGIIKPDSLIGMKELLNTWLCLTKEEKIKMNQKARESYEKLFALTPAVNKFLEAIKSGNAQESS